MKPQLAIPLLLIASAMIMTATPAFATTPPTYYCSNTVPVSPYTYTLSISPCSAGQTPLTTLTLTATTNDPSIVRVEFTVTPPMGTGPTLVAVGASPFVQAFTPSITGTYRISATFCDNWGTCVSYDVISFIVQILVTNVMPLGVVSALGVSLAGLFAYTRIKKRPLPR